MSFVSSDSPSLVPCSVPPGLLFPQPDPVWSPFGFGALLLFR